MASPAMALAMVSSTISTSELVVLNNYSTNGRKPRHMRLHLTARPSCTLQHHQQNSHVVAGQLQFCRKDVFTSNNIYGKALPEVRRSSMTTGSRLEASAGNIDMGEEDLVDGVTLRHGFLKNNDIRVHFVECGDPTGKLVLLIHGWPNFWYIWKNQFKALSEAGYHVIALDLRGYNLSSKPDDLESYKRSAVLDDIVKFINHFGDGDAAIMVGHDWGSTISWCMAEDHPNKVEKLVTVNMGRLTDFSRILTSNVSQLLRSWYIGAFQVPYLAEATIAYNNCLILRAVLQNSIPTMTDNDIERHVKAYSHPGAMKGSLSFYRAAVRGLWHQSGKVPVVETPVTVLWGYKDDFLLPIVAEPDKATAPNAKVVHLPQAGHWPMWHDPELFNELLLKTIENKGA
ncbi:hypothetical protein R1flu_005394 [Riccia fluitans]|uniref:AB hydrolase-1 domain-containing protein n=1 Tax=Riccia fluitans TaxID=41844 RepID=A0ABD1YTB5_9MARC